MRAAFNRGRRALDFIRRRDRRGPAPHRRSDKPQGTSTNRVLRHGRARMGLFLSRGISHFFRLFVAPRERGLEPDRGPLLAFDPLATRDGDGRSLVKAEAAGGGGPKPAFTR